MNYSTYVEIVRLLLQQQGGYNSPTKPAWRLHASRADPTQSNGQDAEVGARANLTSVRARADMAGPRKLSVSKNLYANKTGRHCQEQLPHYTAAYNHCQIYTLQIMAALPVCAGSAASAPAKPASPCPSPPTSSGTDASRWVPRAAHQWLRTACETVRTGQE